MIQPITGATFGALAEAQCLPRRRPCDIGRLTTAAWCSGSGGKDSSFTIYVGTLDDSSSFHPMAAAFARSRPAWAVIPPGLTKRGIGILRCGQDLRHLGRADARCVGVGS
jgi:hypothetical protein